MGFHVSYILTHSNSVILFSVLYCWINEWRHILEIIVLDPKRLKMNTKTPAILQNTQRWTSREYAWYTLMYIGSLVVSNLHTNICKTVNFCGDSWPLSSAYIVNRQAFMMRQLIIQCNCCSFDLCSQTCKSNKGELCVTWRSLSNYTVTTVFHKQTKKYIM